MTATRLILAALPLIAAIGVAGIVWLTGGHVVGKHKARARDDRWDA